MRDLAFDFQNYVNDDEVVANYIGSAIKVADPGE
jgi:hypothetical protein